MRALCKKRAVLERGFRTNMMGCKLRKASERGGGSVVLDWCDTTPLDSRSTSEISNAFGFCKPEAGLSPQEFIEAVKWLENKGCSGITGEPLSTESYRDQGMSSLKYPPPQRMEYELLKS